MSTHVKGFEKGGHMFSKELANKIDAAARDEINTFGLTTFRH